MSLMRYANDEVLKTTTLLSGCELVIVAREECCRKLDYFIRTREELVGMNCSPENLFRLNEKYLNRTVSGWPTHLAPCDEGGL